MLSTFLEKKFDFQKQEKLVKLVWKTETIEILIFQESKTS